MKLILKTSYPAAKVSDWTLKGIGLLFSIYFAVKLFVFIVDFNEYPYQHEYRESSAQSVVQLLKLGENPYDFKHSPSYSYAYGFVYPVIGYLFSPNNTITELRWITIIFGIFSALLLAYFFWKKGVDPILCGIFIPFLVFRMLMSSYGAFPTLVGQFFFLVALLVPLLSRSWRALGVSIIAGFLAFHSKAYFLIGSPLVAIILFLFFDKKKGLIYGISFIVLVLGTIDLIDRLMPSYFSTTFYGFLGSSLGKLDSHRNSQIQRLWDGDFPIILTWIGVTILATIGTLRSGNSKIINIDLFSLKKPIIEGVNIAMILLGLSIFFFFLFYFYLGKFQGSGEAAYFYHLGFPFVIAFILVATVESRLKLGLFTTFIFTYFIYSSSFWNIDFEKQRREMEVIKGMLDEYETVANMPDVASILIERGDRIYDNGHIGVFFDANTEANPKRERISQYRSKFDSTLNQGILDRRFDLIMFNHIYSKYGIIGDYLNKEYQFLGTYRVPTYFQNLPTDFWVLKQDTASAIPENFN